MSYHQKAKAACGSDGTPDDLQTAVESAQESFNPFNPVDWLCFALLAFRSRNDAVLQFILDTVQSPLDTLNHIREHCVGAEEERIDGWIERITTALKEKIHEIAKKEYNNKGKNSSILHKILRENRNLLEFAAHKACEALNPPMLKDVLSIIAEFKTLGPEDNLYRRMKITLSSFRRCGITSHIDELKTILDEMYNYKTSYGKAKSNHRFHPY